MITDDGFGARFDTLARRFVRRLYVRKSEENEIILNFARTYTRSSVEGSWLGETLTTPPLDLWVYQEILHKVAPDLVIANTANARYLATLCEIRGSGVVVSISMGFTGVREHPRLRRIAVEATSEQGAAIAAEVTADKRNVLVVLGRGQEEPPLLEELRLYRSLVTPGSYMIVEDTSSGSDAAQERARAVEAFLSGDGSFVVDPAWEKFHLTFNRKGYLRRVN